MTQASTHQFQIDIEVIFRDIDAMGHVNNAVYFTYMETARTRFFRDKLNLTELKELPVILAEASCTYLSAARFGECLKIILTVSHIGTKSFGLAYQIRAADGRLVAAGRSTMVAYDYRAEKSIPIPPNLKNLLEVYLVESGPDT